MVVASRCREIVPSACLRDATLPSVDDLLHILQELRQKRSKEKNTQRFLAHLRYVHLSICELGLDGHSDLCNYLVPIFFDNGFFLEAIQIFHKTPRRNEYAWTSLIESWYVDFFDVHETFKMYEHMKKDDVLPSKCTLLALLRACRQSLFMMGGLFIHHEVVSNNIEEDSFLASSLVHMYSKCGLLFEAQTVFDKLHIRDVVTWNALMVGYAELGYPDEVLNCLNNMKEGGVFGDAITFLSCLKACSNIGIIEKGLYVHLELVTEGYETDAFIRSTLVGMYAKLGLLKEAQELLDELPICDVISWTSLIMGYADHGLGEQALI